MKRSKVTIVVGIMIIIIVMAVIMVSYTSDNRDSFEEFGTTEWVDVPDDNIVASEAIDSDFVFTEHDLSTLELPVEYMTIPDDYEYDLNVYLMVALALDKYFNSNVPEVFDFDFQRDLGEQQTNLVFNVSVNSSSYNLNMLLDLYGLKVVVTNINN